MSLIKVSVPGFINKVYKTQAGIVVPMFDAFISKHQNILAVLGTATGALLIPGCNIVSNAGDLFYAKLAAGEVPTNTFTTHELASAGIPGKAATRATFTPIASTQKVQTTGYPKTNDGDTDNTGAGADIRTSLASYAGADFTAASGAITHGIITNLTPGASEPILCGYAFAAGFGKTATDTLKVFVNHTMNGI